MKSASSAGKFVHHLIHRASTQSEWCSPDTQILLEKHKSNKKSLALLKEYGWSDGSRSVHYQFNKHGFRDDEFDGRACAMAVGCSHTEGAALPRSDNWVGQLNRNFQRRQNPCYVWNLGINGSGSATCLRVIQHWASILRPRFIVCVLPYEPRIEVQMIDGSFESVLPANIEFCKSIHKNDVFYKHWITQELNWQRNITRDIMAMRWRCHELGIPILVYHSSILETLYNKKYGAHAVVPRARDLMHYGPECHRLFAKRVLKDVTALGLT